MESNVYGILVGDSVFSIKFGYGTIVRILKEDVKYPICVEFGENLICLNIDGGSDKSDNFDAIFFGER